MHLEQYVARSPQTASQVIDGEAVVLTSGDGTFRVFNRTGTRIWELLQEPKTVQALVEAIHAQFEVEEAQAQADVIAFLEELRAKGMVTLVEPSEEQAS